MIIKNTLLITIISFFIMNANAYTFGPSVVTITTTGNASSYLYTITNSENRVIPIDISIHKFSKDFDGNPIQGEEVHDEFVIYPAQFILKKGQERSIQVRWVGKQDIEVEQSYTILCKEIALPEKKKEETGFSASVNILMNYAGRLYVRPKEARSEIIIESIGAPLNDKGEQELEIVCVNNGNLHGKLVHGTFYIRQGAKKGDSGNLKPFILTMNELAGMSSSILAKSKRKFSILWPEGLPLGQINVELIKE
ncbi:MAG: molecular chaperone [Candidatus Delongbacteria bacterium]|nr:molecular chaperone [Candidatus Delongbacteria bacterium]